jgi:hypothetical protein
MKRFDLVVLKTIKNVKWMSGPAGRPARPKGNWVVVCGVEGDKLLIAKDETVIKIPAADVMLVGSYDTQMTIEAIKKVKTLEDLKKIGGQNGDTST